MKTYACEPRWLRRPSQRTSFATQAGVSSRPSKSTGVLAPSHEQCVYQESARVRYLRTRGPTSADKEGRAMSQARAKGSERVLDQVTNAPRRRRVRAFHRIDNSSVNNERERAKDLTESSHQPERSVVLGKRFRGVWVSAKQCMQTRRKELAAKKAVHATERPRMVVGAVSP